MGQLTEKYKLYREPQKFMEADVYPYFREIEGKQGTEVEMGGHKVLMLVISVSSMLLRLHLISMVLAVPVAVS